MILGIGTDLVNINRINLIIEKFPKVFVNKILSSSELSIYNKITHKHNKASYVAKRFAAKEAFAKAVGCGIYRLGFKNINILNNSVGKPYVKLDFDLNQYFNLTTDVKIHHQISLSDEKDYAVTFAIIWV